MNTLPLRRQFVGGQITCRLLRNIERGDTLIVAIPGGPALSSVYLDPFMKRLSETTGCNVATMDLPNHGESQVDQQRLPLSYSDCVEYVAGTVEELSNTCGNIVLFGQSMGARLAFDVLGQIAKQVSGVLLTGFPYTFEISSGLASKLNELPLEAETGSDAEKKHARNWEKILPLYTVAPLPEDAANALLRDKDIRGNERMLEAVPDIRDVASALKARSLPPICIIEGPNDPVVPDNNWKILREVLPEGEFVTLSDVGHFPMLEQQERILKEFGDFISQEVRA